MNTSFNNLWNDRPENPYLKNAEDFENNVADEFFPDNTYEILHRTHDFRTNAKRFIRSSMAPDFHFEIRNTNIQFWVECKHRQNYYNEMQLEVFKPGQLTRYKSYPNSFLFLGTYLDGQRHLYFVPFYKIKWKILFFSFLQDFEFPYNPPVYPSFVIRYLSS